MKWWILILLLPLAFGGCVDDLTSLEQANPAAMKQGAVFCRGDLTTDQLSVYSNFSALGEGHRVMAECFTETGLSQRAKDSYLFSAKNYSAAAQSLCSSDYSLKLGLMISSAETYSLAGFEEISAETYSEAFKFYGEHSKLISEQRHTQLRQSMLDTQNTLADTITPPGQQADLDFLPLAIAGIVFVGIGLVIFFLRK